MKNIVCVNCLKKLPTAVDPSSSAISLCVYCGAQFKIKRDKNGKVRIEEMEAAEDVLIAFADLPLANKLRKDTS